MIPRQYLGAFKAGHRQASREFIDEDLSRRLLVKAEAGCEESRIALVWLTKFNNEYHKNVIKKGDESAFHNTSELRSEAFKRDYARNNDIFSVPGMVVRIDDREITT